MLSSTQLKQVLARPGLTRTERLLACLAFDADKPKAVSAIRDVASGHGLRAAAKWNASSLLGASGGKAIRAAGGWELTDAGRTAVRAFAGVASPSPASQSAETLRKLLPKLPSAEVRSFVDEAISCCDAHLYRAAVVLSWVGAIAILYDHVATKQIASFNTEAARRDAKWKTAKTSDDLARMKEHDFLQVLEAISVIGRNVKQELEGALKLRNGCGHPNTLQIGEAKVAAHIETLALNVYSRF